MAGMNLYEIVLNRTGESYVRAYAWAPDEAEARRLYAAKNPEFEADIARVALLFSEGVAPFCTEASDCGWSY